MSIDPEDYRRLRACVTHVEKHDEDASKFDVKAFRDMITRDRPLTPKQKSWVADVYERVLDEPLYSNDWSAGRVPRGEQLATPLPDVLRRPLPLKPPGGRP